MNKKSVIHLAQSAAKFFFDLEPETTELLVQHLLAKTGRAADEVLPTIVEAYKCQKLRFAQYFQRSDDERYQVI